MTVSTPTAVTLSLASVSASQAGSDNGVNNVSHPPPLLQSPFHQCRNSDGDTVRLGCELHLGTHFSSYKNV